MIAQTKFAVFVQNDIIIVFFDSKTDDLKKMTSIQE